jgi:hypothetical protein
VIKFVGDVLKSDGFLRVSTTNETDRHDLTELLLKVALNTITIYSMYFPSYQCTQKILWLNFTGKRSKLYPIETVMLEKQQNSKQTREENLQERKMSQKRCMPLFSIKEYEPHDLKRIAKIPLKSLMPEGGER